MKLSQAILAFPRCFRGTIAGSDNIGPITGYHEQAGTQSAAAGPIAGGGCLVIFDVSSAAPTEAATRLLSKVLKCGVRSCDRILGWFDTNSVGVLMADTPSAQARAFAERVVRSAAHLTRCSPRYRICAVAPDHSAPWSEATAVSAEGNVCTTNTADRGTTHRIADISAVSATGRWKRALDILGAAVGLALLSPVLLAAAILIKCVSRGPVFFRQDRIGYRGRVFKMWKFRTYEVNADTDQHRRHVCSLIAGSDINTEGSQAPMTKLDAAPGIIPFGNLLRKTCIDELPQLINVLLGDMSLVGPRPALAYEVEQYADWHKGRLNALPGMTGLWQVSGKNRLTFNEMVRLDIRYSRRASLALDILILLKTPVAVVRQVLDSLRMTAHVT